MGAVALVLRHLDDRRSFAQICGFAIPRVRGIHGQQPGSMVVPVEVSYIAGDAGVAPTKTCPDKTGTAYRSVPWAPLHSSCATLTIRDHLRKSAVWRSHLSEIRGQQSRSIIANLEVFTTMRRTCDAGVAPTKIMPNPTVNSRPVANQRGRRRPDMRLDRSMGAVALVLRDLDDRRSSAQICVICGGRSRSTITVDGC